MTNNLIFFGDDQYSALTARRLLAAHEIHTIVTKDRPDNPMVELAQKHNIPLAYYPDIPPLPKDSLGILASFGAILPESHINQFGEAGILCLHPSLLPQYRGATPAQHTIALGDQETGITLFKLTSVVDQGEILAQAKAPILQDDTTPTLLTRLFALGADLLVNYLSDPLTYRYALPKPLAKEEPTNPSPTLTRRFQRESGYVEWSIVQKARQGQPIKPTATQNPLLKLALPQNSNSKQALHNLVRALTPWPNVWTTIPTQKGDLRATITQVEPELKVHLSGKKAPISWSDLEKYYL